MRGIVGIVVAIALVIGSAPAAADYLTEAVDRWRENTDAHPPKGLGPIKFDMTPAQVSRLCKGQWEPAKPAGNLLGERTARCHGLPMNLGFDDYQLAFHFYEDKLVSVSLIKPLTDGQGSRAFTRARSSLSAKYGDVPDRTDDYRDSENPQMAKIMNGWGSIYEWRFERSQVPAEAIKITLVGVTVDGVPSMLLSYDSQRLQDLNDELRLRLAPRADNAH